MNSRTPLNVIYVGPFPPRVGGVARSLHLILNTIAKRGHRIRVLSEIEPDWREFDKTFVPRLNSIELTRYNVPLYIYDSRKPDSVNEIVERDGPAIRKNLAAMMAAQPCELVICGHEVYASIIPNFCRERSVPCVQLLRGSPTCQILDGLLPEQQSEGWLHRYRAADYLIPVAYYFAERLRSLGCNKLTHIPNAVDIEVFLPLPKSQSLLSKLGINNNQIVVLHPSLFHTRKRVADIVEAAAIARNRNSDVVYVLAGDGETRNVAEQLCAEKGIANSVRFVGPIEYEQMPEYYSIADLVVMPSKGEGLSRVYLETQACGRTLIASDIPATLDVVEDTRTGLLFRVAEIDDLAEKILLAAESAQLRAEIGRAGRAQVERRNSPDRIADAYVGVFRELLDGATRLS